MQNSIELVSTDNQIMVSTRTVAEHFGKEHKNVLRDVREIMSSIDADFSRLNFEQRDYVDYRGKTLTEYLITKDGFLVLAMGFTGPVAMAWKVKFIKAFNRVHDELEKAKLEILEKESKLNSLLNEELARKEQVILQLQAAKKKRKTPRIRVPNYNVFDGHEPLWELRNLEDLSDPMKTLGLLRKTVAQIDGLRKLARQYKETLGILEQES